MKRRVLFLTLVFVGLCTPAFARQNFIDRFLSRYKPPSSSPASTGPLTQDRLPALIRNGEIPLSVEDLINLTLENNLDISVSRLNPIASEYLILTNNRPFEPMLRVSANVVAGLLTEHDAVDGRGFRRSRSVNNFTVGYSADTEDRRRHRGGFHA